MQCRNHVNGRTCDNSLNGLQTLDVFTRPQATALLRTILWFCLKLSICFNDNRSMCNNCHFKSSTSIFNFAEFWTPVAPRSHNFCSSCWNKVHYVQAECSIQWILRYDSTQHAMVMICPSFKPVSITATLSFWNDKGFEVFKRLDVYYFITFRHVALTYPLQYSRHVTWRHVMCLLLCHITLVVLRVFAHVCLRQWDEVLLSS